MRILRILLVVFVFILVIALIINFIFGGSNTSETSDSADAPTSSPAQQFADAATTDATVSFVTDGVINGNEQHRQIQIVVSKNARTLTIIQGYQGQVLSTQSFSNNTDAFSEFLSAIYAAGFTSERTNVEQTDMDGQCSLGYRYIYSSTGISNVPPSLWTTTCSVKTGTFGGKVSTVNSLFQKQIPNYSSLVNGVSLN
jgi:uncharacterized protein YpmB